MALAIERIDEPLSVCKVEDYSLIDLNAEFVFTGRTDAECSLVCPTALVPARVLKREDGWRAFRIGGALDFSLTGILAPIATLLADAEIGIFALSTFDTDYVLVKETAIDRALTVLDDAGYRTAIPTDAEQPCGSAKR